MHSIKVKLKTGENVVLDFNNYTFWEYSFNDTTIRPNTKLLDKSNEMYVVDRILFDSIILKDSQDNIYDIPKKEINNFKRKNEIDNTLNKNFATFCMYLGTGNISSKIWFVGIEEGGKSVSEKNLNQQLILCENETQNFPEAIDNTPVWNTISNLLYEKFKSVHQLNEQEYRRKMFSKEYPFFFLTELLPLPKTRTSDWPENYFEIFGYNKDDYYKYLSDVRSYRFPKIYKEWNKAKPKITICMGSTFWNEFINLFKLGHSPFFKLDGLNIIHYPNENIILAPFFGNGALRRKEKEKLKELINKISIT